MQGRMQSQNNAARTAAHQPWLLLSATNSSNVRPLGAMKSGFPVFES